MTRKPTVDRSGLLVKRRRRAAERLATGPVVALTEAIDRRAGLLANLAILAVCLPPVF